MNPKIREALDIVRHDKTCWCDPGECTGEWPTDKCLNRIADKIAALDDGWIPWQAEAYVKLGHIRDSLPVEHVAIIQDFIGEFPTPPKNKSDD